MKILRIAAALVLCTGISAHASPVTYSFTATAGAEFEGPVWAGPPQPPVITTPIFTNRIFDENTIISGSFVYDSETLPSIDIPALTSYRGAITDVSATVNGYNILGATTVATIIHPSAAIPKPLPLLNFSGNTAPIAIGDWTTTTFSLSWSGFTGATLPAVFPSTGGFNLNFIDSQGALQRQIAFGSLVVTAQAPEPATLSLFGVGFLFVAIAHRRRKFF